MSDFSVLIAVYAKENPYFLDAALESIENQTLPAKEIVLVEDGLLTGELNKTIVRHTRRSKIPYKIFSLEKNMGLGIALSRGLEYCNCEWIARMDSDDIAMTDRFKEEFVFLEKNPECDVVGGWICEFDQDPEACVKERRVPLENGQIVKFARYRNPMNHMTVLFRKSAVLDVGGYRSMHGFEDYDLWMRMIMAGKQFANIPKVLVRVRAGREMMERRQGWRYTMDEVKFEKAAYITGFWSAADLFRNLFVRILPRLLPVAVVEKLYNLLRK